MEDATLMLTFIELTFIEVEAPLSLDGGPVGDSRWPASAAGAAMATGAVASAAGAAAAGATAAAVVSAGAGWEGLVWPYGLACAAADAAGASAPTVDTVAVLAGVVGARRERGAAPLEPMLWAAAGLLPGRSRTGVSTCTYSSPAVTSSPACESTAGSSEVGAVDDSDEALMTLGATLIGEDDSVISSRSTTSRVESTDDMATVVALRLPWPTPL